MHGLPPGAPAVVAAAAALVGTPALDWLVPEHRAKMSKKLAAARDAVAAMDAAGVTERVVACGRVVRLQRPDGSTVPVSLWVKVKFPLPGTPASVLPTTGLQSPTTAIDGVLRDHRERFHADMVRAESISAATRAAAYKKPAPAPAAAVPRAGPCLVWVMEEVQQTVLTCTVRARDGGMTRLKGPWSDVFGSGAVDENTPLSRVVPGLLEFERSETGSVDLAAVRAARRKYFTAQSAAGVVVPLILRLDPLDTAISRFDDLGPCFTAQLLIMPHLAGLVTVDAHGRVVACMRPYSLVPTEIAVLDLVARTHPHPNIARMVAFWEDEAVYGVEMALPDDGGDTQMDLFDYVELHTSMAEREVQYIFRSVCAAVAHLHSLNVVHRDIKDENVVLSMTNRSVLHVELIDFGSAAYARSAVPTMDVFCGTVEYCPPEIALGRKYQGKPQDVWSLGVLLYVLLYKEAPFANFDEIVAKEVRVPYVVSPSSVDLLLRMLKKDPAARPTMDEVLAHPWLAAATAPVGAAAAAPAAGNN
ncbi:CAMK/CAMKL/PASK protein kinase [Allomyces macrogynus ATCC 38327]|uniref:CAMK/CAMKL/PASK protein kinase n=1 Tax=Allomyces macrogynus (strain ATCC 38327) TaxID=578462 RepID=A0A0L0T7Y7_ALLM3|nr:CAMK/CAMKL/PASK protein kinase [Allomyces macrogynus ATCC 38327]|eukprot:KNE70811.1 CAMK/CAMKL/PASK protein kinase [Allomyces macrogynus ATCC 38327]